jgi:Uma2 family endonuclease
MSTAMRNTRPPAGTELLPASRFHRFTIEQYERLTELGVLKTADRVELLEGWIVDKMTQYPPHATSIELVQEALRPLLPAAWVLRDQKPVHTSDSRPEPDVAVVRGPTRKYSKRHPVAADIALVIEVADTTLETDREWKGAIYARARLAVYWIVNLLERKVEVYTEPRAGRAASFRRRIDYGPDDKVPVVIGGRELGRLEVRDLLPG